MYSLSGKNLLSNGSGKFFCSILGSTWKFPSFRYIYINHWQKKEKEEEVKRIERKKTRVAEICRKY